jgi:superfamily II DNA/RNA helicase
MAYAPTGSGKTAAFLLPIINELQNIVKDNENSVSGKQPYAIIVSPTKELANQLYEDALAFALS